MFHFLYSLGIPKETHVPLKHKEFVILMFRCSGNVQFFPCYCPKCLCSTVKEESEIILLGIWIGITEIKKKLVLHGGVQSEIAPSM